MSKRKLPKRARNQQNNGLSSMSLAKRGPKARGREELMTTLMEEKGLTYEDLANECGYNTQMVKSFCSGKIDLVLPAVAKIAAMLDITTDQLLDEIMIPPGIVIEAAKEDMRKNNKKSRDTSDEEEKEDPAAEAEEEPKDTTSEDTLDPEEISSSNDIITGEDGYLNVQLGLDEKAIMAELEKSEEQRLPLPLTPSDVESTYWIPDREDLNAILTLCTDRGLYEAYEAIWKVLQNPLCRKGGRVNRRIEGDDLCIS